MTYRYRRFTPGVVLGELRALGTALAPGEPLPQFSLPTIDGGRFDTAEHAGRPMLIAFASFT